MPVLPRRLLPRVVPGLLLPAAAAAQGSSFEAFLASVRREALSAGISAATLDRAFSGLRPNQRVIELDRRQAEFTLTWEQYRDGRLSAARIEQGRRMEAQHRGLLAAVEGRFRVSPGIILGIWGLETNYGGFTGQFRVIEALATLAWEGRRAAFFRTELLAALRILEAGHITPERMIGSHAGAMGQPQFMPTSFERLAVDFDGDGRRDIWGSVPDTLGSIANYLARSGWRGGEGWGFEVILPPGFDPALAEPARPRPAEEWRSLGEWQRLGLRRADGAPLGPSTQRAGLILPANQRDGRQAFLALPNFHAIRRYNPSNFYALVVGMLGDRILP
ncbi:MAG: lytic murein transglycosylase [Rhodovarius sp.]|nr:lytic murein transglycosylase [Rhodovarius sp.]MCX7933317.1 lytic murein transglycosylase [Rhodovarius sp.]MDW8314185.1 lytic murein transglycosylase [Rhodovarius sp.]